MREVKSKKVSFLPAQLRLGRSDKGLPKGVFNNFWFEFFNAAFWQSLGSPLLLFIRQSGGSALAIGLTSALPLLLMPITLASSRQVEKFGYRRTAFTFWTLRWILSSLMIIVALLDFPGFNEWRVPVAFFILIMYHFCRNLGISGWWPWITAIIAVERRGLYLSRVALFSNLGSIGTFLAVGAILGSNPGLQTFALVFAFGVMGGVISSLFMSRIARPASDHPTNNPQARANFWKSLSLYLKLPGFKTFLVIQSFYGVAFFGIPSLGLIYLREKVGIAPGLILLFSTLGVIGASLTAGFWGDWIDRKHEVNSLQLLAFAGLCINSLLWLSLQFVPAGFNYFVAAVLMCASAIWISALNLSQSHSIMSLAPEDNRVMFQNIAIFLTYCSQAVAPTLWGLLLDMLDHQKVKLVLGSMQFGAYQIFFAATLLIGLAGAGFIVRVLRRNKTKALA